MKHLRRRIREWAKENKRSDIPCLRKAKFWIENGICEPEFDVIIERLLQSIKFGNAITRERMIVDYGDVIGEQRWNYYVHRQAVTNTKEYKMAVHGMTSEEVDEYNKSRAVTLDNMIRRYGEEEGTKRFNSYCERQSYAGCKLEYFIEKYGEDDGRDRYNNISVQKSHSYETYIAKYGYEEGIRRLEQFHSKLKSRGAISHKQTAFIDKLESFLTPEERKHGYREYTVFCPKLKRVFKYDYVNTALGVAIEYNGVYWHGSPKLYLPTDVVRHNLTAQDIWEGDVIKMKSLIDNRYIKHYNVVWEYDEWSDDEIKRKLNEYRILQ